MTTLHALGREPESRLHHLWRDLMPALAIGMAAIAIFGLEDKVDGQAVNAKTAKVEARIAKKLAESQLDGRRVSLGVTCGALRGVQDAGRLVLTNRLPGTARYFPPSTARERGIRRVLARAYNRVITDRIVQEAGASGTEVIEGNGSVDCDALRKVGRTGPKP